MAILLKIVINLCRDIILEKLVAHMIVSKNSCNKLSGQFKLKAVECAKSLDVQLQRKMSRSTQEALSHL